MGGAERESFEGTFSARERAEEAERGARGTGIHGSEFGQGGGGDQEEVRGAGGCVEASTSVIARELTEFCLHICIIARVIEFSIGPPGGVVHSKQGDNNTS